MADATETNFPNDDAVGITGGPGDTAGGPGDTDGRGVADDRVADDGIPAPFREWVEGYLSDSLSPEQMTAMEMQMKADAAARRFFARYASFDRDVRQLAHANLQGERALATLGFDADERGGSASVASDDLSSARFSTEETSAAWLRIRPLRWLAAAAVVALAVGAGFWAAKQQNPTIAENPKGSTTNATTPITPVVSRDVAWLVNAQNCQWADGSAPVDMKPGTLLKIDRGLAEVRFGSGAVVLLEGPLRLELLSANSAKLHRGRLTGKVEGPIKGFELFSPAGRVIDLGTEFGVAVADGGETDVYVFDGKVQAVGPDQRVIDLGPQQAARLTSTGAAQARQPGAGELEAFARQIVPPPVIEPNTMRVNFGKAYGGTIADAQGLGTGLTHRLPGTGGTLSADDQNLVVNSNEGRLELTTTDSDINGQAGMPTGEYLGARLADLGFTGVEDFEVEVFIPDIPALKNIGQFGLYAGSKSDRVIRGGLISRGKAGPYEIFMTNNDGGKDRDSHFLGLFSTGDDLRIRLSRIDGKFSLTVENLTVGSSSTVSIRHPAYLDAENDLYVGLFGANTQSKESRTLYVKEFAVTVWTRDGREAKQLAAVR